MGRPRIPEEQKIGKKDRRTMQAVTYAVQGKSTSDISKITGLTTDQVCIRLEQFKPLFDQLEHLAVYRKAKIELLEAAEQLALQSVVAGLKDTSNPLSQRVAAFKALHDATRVERGQATSITTTLQYSDLPSDLRSLIDVTPISKSTSSSANTTMPDK